MKPIAGTGEEQYIPYSERTGEESVVYFTRDLSAEGLKKIYERVKKNMAEKSALNCILANRTVRISFPVLGWKI